LGGVCNNVHTNTTERTMNKLETLAEELVWLSNKSLTELADHLVKDAPTRADALINILTAALQERERAKVLEC